MPCSIRARCLTVLTLVALASSAFIASPAPAQESTSDDTKKDVAEEINEEWYASDLKVIERLKKLEKPTGWNRKTLLEQLGKPGIDAERDLDFGGARLEIRLSGGYASAWIYAVLHDDRLAALDVHFRPSRAAWTARKDAYVKAGGQLFTQGDDGLRTNWNDADTMKRWRAAVHAKLGKPPAVTKVVSRKDQAPLNVLSDPTQPMDVGTLCYYAGTPPEGRAAIDALVKTRRIDLVHRVLRGVHPEARVYAALALLEFDKTAKPGAGLKQVDFDAIALIRKSKIAISTCSGCTVYDQTAAKILPAPK